MTKITIEECVYIVHPIYDLYASSKDGNIINIIKKVPKKGNKKRDVKCDMQVNVRKYGGMQKRYQVHRFVYECFNGSIPDGKVIDHINNDKEDNRLCNLQLMTPQQNCKKSAKDRDYSFVAQNHKNRKCLKAINKDTNEISYYNSLYAVNQHLGVNVGIVKMVCEGFNGYKSGISKKDGHSYSFEYVKEDDLPDDHKKSANKRPRRVSDEDKKKHRMEWRKKEYKCPKCDKTFKNSYRYIHNKKCNSQKQ